MNIRILLRGPIARITAVSLGSNIVDGIRTVAFAVLAGNYAESALQVAIVATVATLPEVFFSIPLGVMIDRWDKVRILYTTNLARAFLLISLAVTLYLDIGSIFSLCIFAFLFGVLESLYDSVSVLIVPDLTQPNEYLKSNVVIRWIQEIGNGSAGPFLGSILIGWSSTTPFIFSTGILLIVAFTLRSLHRSDILVTTKLLNEKNHKDFLEDNEYNRTAIEISPKATTAIIESRIQVFINELKEGLVVAWENSFARNIVIVFGLWNLFGWMPESILIIYVLEVLKGDESMYGLLLAITSLGTLLGGLVVLITPKSFSVRKVTSLALGIYSLTFLIPGIWPIFWVTAIAFFIQGVPLVLLNGTISAQMQLTIERSFLGRVYAVIGTVGSLGMSGGLFLGGVFADLISVPFVFVLSGVGIGVAALVATLTFSSIVAGAKYD